MAAPAPRKSDGPGLVAEALTRFRDEFVRTLRHRFPSLDADELFQRGALRALEHSDQVRDPEKVRGWLRRVLVTTALDTLREGRRRQGLVASKDAEEVEALSEASNVCACSVALVGALPESYAAILRKVDMEGMGLGEFASSMQIATGNAAVRLHRARRALRAKLQDHCGVQSMGQCLTCVCSERACCGTS